jgi:hypothetical protein
LKINHLATLRDTAGKKNNRSSEMRWKQGDPIGSRKKSPKIRFHPNLCITFFESIYFSQVQAKTMHIKL